MAFGQGFDSGEGLAFLVSATGKGDVKDVVFSSAPRFRIRIDAESAGELDAAFTNLILGAEIGDDSGAFLARSTVDDPGHVANHGASFVDVGDDDERDLVAVDVAGWIVLSLTRIDQGSRRDVVTCPGASRLHDRFAVFGDDAPPLPVAVWGVVVVLGRCACITEVIDPDVFWMVGIGCAIGIDHHAGLAKAGIFTCAAPEVHEACSGPKLMDDRGSWPFAIDRFDDGNSTADFQSLNVI